MFGKYGIFDKYLFDIFDKFDNIYKFLSSTQAPSDIFLPSLSLFTLSFRYLDKLNQTKSNCNIL